MEILEAVVGLWELIKDWSNAIIPWLSAKKEAVDTITVYGKFVLFVFNAKSDLSKKKKPPRDTREEDK